MKKKQSVENKEKKNKKGDTRAYKKHAPPYLAQNVLIIFVSLI
ncbi:hypothetical protein V7158_25685 [Priestia megaterium]